MSENFYNILGVSETATQDEIKRAYRGLSLKWHPDKNNNSEEANSKFKTINEAYETLGDETQRGMYDASRNQNPFFNMGMGGGGTTEQDIFNMLFGSGGGGIRIPGGVRMPGGFMPPGGGGGAFHIFNTGVGLGDNNNPFNFMQNMQKPTPIVKNITITMEQVFGGANIPIDIERWIVENSNKVFERETLYVPIPKGIDDGEIIIIRDKGNIINDAVRGDVKIFIKVEPHPVFQRKGLDLITNQKISLKDALCGFVIEYKHINEKTYTLNNTNNSIINPDYKKVIPGMGLTREQHTGNLILIFIIEFPTQLTPEQVKVLRDNL
jgi:DnaJ-class molecular chaperone